MRPFHSSSSSDLRRLKMIHFARLLCLTALSLLTLTCIVDGQTGSRSQAPEATKPTKAEAAPIPDKTAETEAARILRERQTHAQSLLISLAVEAGSFRDQRLRAQTLSRIADMLWVSDPERGRTLFRKAWDAAVIADAEEQQRVQEEIRKQKAKSAGGGYSVSPLPELREEIVRLAAKRDVALGDEFLAKLKEQKEQEAGAVKNSQSQERDAAAAQRLGLASQLLSTGDTQQALRVADPILGTVSAQTLSFLSTLREKNPAAADERYAAMLSSATANPQSDANTASLLSAYIFTPYP